MSVLFASIDEKIQIPIHTTHSGIKSIKHEHFYKNLI